MWFSPVKIFSVLLLVAGFSNPGLAQLEDSLTDYNRQSRLPTKEATIVSGRILFQNHCSSCHMIHYELIGPALASIGNKRPLPWLHKFIKNSQAVIRGGDAYAGGLYGRYNNTIMPPFEFLSNQEINNILAYIKQESTLWVPTAGANPREDMKRYHNPAVQSITAGNPMNVPVRDTVLVDNDLGLFTIAMYILVPISLALFTFLSIKLFKATTK